MLYEQREKKRGTKGKEDIHEHEWVVVLGRRGVERSLSHQHCLFLIEVRPGKLASFQNAAHKKKKRMMDVHTLLHFLKQASSARILAKSFPSRARGIENLPFQFP